jgi:hypothetical protein
MTGDSLQRRDWEILRTICRLRYVTTQEIIATFFSTPSVGRRRLRRLSGLDLITPHRKGVPAVLPYYAWRLTSRGLDAVAAGFPDEPIPDGLAERLADASLHNLDHRAALTRLYLGLLAAATDRTAAEPDLAAVRAAVDALRARGNQFWWQPDGDVVLRCKKLGEDVQIVPDATVCGRHRSVRIFVELDRSTRGLTRIAENLDRYAWVLGHAYKDIFPDGRSALLLYVVRSEGRRAGIAELAGRVIGTASPWAVLPEKAAVRWLEEAVVDATHDGPTNSGVRDGDDRLVAVAKSVYAWARGYEKQLRGEGRAFPPDGQALLLDLYNEIKARRARRAG